MEALQNPVIYLTLAVLLIVAFFQVKKGIENFFVTPNIADASGNHVTLDNSGNIVKLDASGNSVPLLSSDVTNFFRRAFGSFFASTPASATAQSTTATATGAAAAATATPAPSTTTESPGTAAETAQPSVVDLPEETKQRLATSIVTQIKDSLLAQRATTPVSGGAAAAEPAPYSESECLYQGQEYNTQQPSKSFDMNEYIRKDSIPCWGCTLPA